jgi:calcium-binding protein CML
MGSLKSLKRSKSTDTVPAVAQTQALIHKCEVAELEMAFKVFDANGDGQICISELGTLLRSLGGGEVTQEELELIMNDVDKDKNGFISLEEFKEVHNVGVQEGDPIRQAFATFDKDGNNLICPDELRAVLQSLGEKGHTLEDCRRMISSVDQNGDGFVDFHEFQNLLSAKS